MQQCIQPTGTNRPRAWRPTLLVLALERSGAAETQPQAWPCPSYDGWSCPAECKISGGHGGGETPVPIPNTAVKPARADGTWGEAPWESRSPPGFLTKPPLSFGSRGFRTFWAGCDRRRDARPLRYCGPCWPPGAPSRTGLAHDETPAPGAADGPARHRRGAPGVDAARAALRPLLRGRRLPGGRPAQRRARRRPLPHRRSSATSWCSSPSGGPGSTSPGSPRPTTSTTCSTASSPSSRSSGS